jgi:hypothetical protein
VKAAAAGRSLKHLLVKAGYEQVKARSTLLCVVKVLPAGLADQ